MKKIQNQKYLLITLKAVILLSGTYLSFIFNAHAGVFFKQAFGGNEILAISTIILLTLLVRAGLCVLLFKFKFLESLYRKLFKKPRSAQVALGLFSMWCAAMYISQFHIGEAGINYPDALGLVRLFALHPWTMSIVLFIPLTVLYLFFVTSFAEIIHSVLTSLACYERKFLIIASVIGAYYIIVLFNFASAYYTFDVLYSYDAMSNPTYSINPFHTWTYHQYPLHSNFTMPIMMMAEPFLALHPLSGSITRTIIQFILLLLVYVMLSRMISKNPTVRLFTLLIFAFSFQSVILSVIVERRVMALVYLIIAIYHSIYQTGKKAPACEKNLWLSVAAGSIIINGYIFLISIKSIKTAAKDLLISGTVFLFIAAFLGKIGGLLDLHGQLNRYESAGWMDVGLDFATTLTHYMYFVASSLFSPPSQPIEHPASWDMAAWGMSQPVTGSIYFLLGIAIFALAILGFILNYKKKFAQIALTGIIVSIVFIFILRLNINENAVVLNTMFYAWSFVSLIIMAIDKLIAYKKIKVGLLATIAVGGLAWNGVMAVRIFRFAVENFPLH